MLKVYKILDKKQIDKTKLFKYVSQHCTYFYLVCFVAEETSIWVGVVACVVMCVSLSLWLCVCFPKSRSYFHWFLISFDSQLSLTQQHVQGTNYPTYEILKYLPFACLSIAVHSTLRFATLGENLSLYFGRSCSTSCCSLFYYPRKLRQVESGATWLSYNRISQLSVKEHKNSRKAIQTTGPSRAGSRAYCR